MPWSAGTLIGRPGASCEAVSGGRGLIRPGGPAGHHLGRLRNPCAVHGDFWWVFKKRKGVGAATTDIEAAATLVPAVLAAGSFGIGGLPLYITVR